MREEITKKLQGLSRLQQVVGALLVGLGAAGLYGYMQYSSPKRGHSDVSSQSRKGLLRYTPTPAEWSAMTTQAVVEKPFRAELVTEGKVAIDEDRSTPVFSPYAGRVTKLLVRPGDAVQKGQPLFTIEAADTVQAQNDYIAAMTAMNKARSALSLAEIQNKRAVDLFEGKAVPLKDVQQAQANLVQAQNDMRSSQTALDASVNKLKIFGFNEQDIDTFRQKGGINPEITISAPIAGTVVQRKIGPGQYVGAGTSDPVYVIGDLSTVWLTAFVRESDAAAVAIGQEIAFTVLALPARPRFGRINYVATAIDPATRRLLVRATIDNKDGLLKPEMFANVTIYSPSDHAAVGVPKTALIYEADQVRVWVANEDKTIELRRVKPGLTNGDLVEVIGNLMPGEKIVTKGSLFIDRAAPGS